MEIKTIAQLKEDIAEYNRLIKQMEKNRITEMSSNTRADAMSVLDSNLIEEIGVHMAKWLMWEPRKDAQKDLKKFINQLQKKIVVKQTVKNGIVRSTELWFSPKEIMKKLNGRTATFFGIAMDKMKNKPVNNVDLFNLDTFSQMGFKISEYEDKIYGFQLRLSFESETIADSIDQYINASKKRGTSAK